MVYEPQIGDRVGASRWPYNACHPGCWEKPWCGVVIALDDPRAWAKTLAFNMEEPDQKEVTAHVAWCKSEGLLDDKCPVLWDFGTEHKVFFEMLEHVRPYADDVRAWQEARAKAYDVSNKLSELAAA